MSCDGASAFDEPSMSSRAAMWHQGVCKCLKIIRLNVTNSSYLNYERDEEAENSNQTRRRRIGYKAVSYPDLEHVSWEIITGMVPQRSKPVLDVSTEFYGIIFGLPAQKRKEEHSIVITSTL